MKKILCVVAKSKVGVLFILFFGLVTPTAFATPVVVNFDDLAVGSYGNSLSHKGVTFSGFDLYITDDTFGRGCGIEHSPPNKLSAFGRPSQLLLEFDNPLKSMGFWLTGAYKTRYIYAYDSDNEILDFHQQEYPMSPGEPTPSGYPTWTGHYDRTENFIHFEHTGIKSVFMYAAGDGFSIDDVQYDPVPEPATMLLLVLGLLGLAGVRRKFRN